jgi:alpha-glucosidase (family GH31 glycosyl hydrolase)
MVVIIDPHLKRTKHYPVYKDASDREVLVKPKSGEGEYEGWCWSGSSSWVDFFNPQSWVWWKNLFKTEKVDGQFSWSESTDSIHIWNDMNEVGPACRVHFGIAKLFAAVSVQRTRNYYAQRQRPLWRLGTPRRPQHQWHAFRASSTISLFFCSY